MNISTAVSIVALSLISLISGCSDKSGKNIASNAKPSEIFNTYCAQCHKETGNGNFLKGIPPNHSTNLSNKQVVDLIINGNAAYPKMVRYPEMSPENGLKIALHLRVLQQAD
jgi:mono/diheme cytochrome c family protein